VSNILVVAAHPDDEVLGCGASICRHSNDGDVVQVVFVADGFGARTDGINRDAAAIEASKILGCESPIFLKFPDNQLDSVALLNIVKALEEVMSSFSPTTIYTHHYGDLNIDHQITHRAVMTACRPQPNFNVKQILTFETMSATHWQSVSMGNMFSPSYFVDVSGFIGQKMQALRCYDQEMRDYPHARSFEALESLSRFRGSSVGLEAAEAFCVERLII